MPGDMLDVVLLVLAAAFAVAGYRQGFIIGILSFGGFIGGALAGLYFAPGVAGAFARSPAPRAVFTILVIFGTAVTGMLIASGAGALLRSKVRRRRGTVLDSIGGAAVNVTAILLLAWMIGTLIAYAPPSASIAAQVRDSVLLRSVGRLIPRQARPEFLALRRLLGTPPYAQVFGALGADAALSVPEPDPAVLRSPGLARDEGSVVKIEGVAGSCSRTIEGSGFVVARNWVVTNAHVVAGVTEGPEVYDRFQTQFPARVVLFDPSRDVAVLYVPGLDLPPLRFARAAPFGASAIVAGYPLDASLTAVAARVGRAVQATGPDIYGNERVVRDIYPIRAVVKPGNSGGPLIAPDGLVYGMVFAAAISVPGTGYALTSSEIAADVRAGEHRTAATPTGGCQ